jgi:hypothetical protein
MFGVLCIIFHAALMGTAPTEMQKRDSKRNKASCKDSEEDPDFDHGLLDDR